MNHIETQKPVHAKTIGGYVSVMRILYFAIGLMASLAYGQVTPRVENTSMDFPANAPSADPYLGEDALGLWFDNPVAIATAPGDTNRLFVVERFNGVKVVSDLGNPSITSFIDLSTNLNTGTENGVLGLAFHPQYASNGYFYVFLTSDAATSVTGNHDRLVRFQVSSTNENFASPSTEQVLFEQYSEWENHNGGDLHFGPDGYLYVSLGDGEVQRKSAIDEGFFNGLLRLDVDKKPENFLPAGHPGVTTNYHIPQDNPFVGATNFHGEAINTNALRAEFWATGLRNPWRFTIDALTGQVIVGDVGDDQWEEVNVILKGRDYGWWFREGPAVIDRGAFNPEPPDYSPVAPILSLAHPDNISVIGGRVYRGTRLPELQGFYMFHDWRDGIMWGVLPNGTNAVTPIRLTEIFGFNAVCYGEDPRNGDLLFNSGGQIRRLIANPGGAQFPLTLDDTGAFTNTPALAPAPGVVPFEINVPFWSDYAIKSRWVSVPDLSDTIDYSSTNHFTFPEGSVFIKHFDLEMVRGNPTSAVPIETRFLVKTSNDVYGLTYHWNSSTQAVLVGNGGMTETFSIQEGTQSVMQTWPYPSRGDCRTCHTPEGGYALGFNAAQLSREETYGSITTNQLYALQSMGYFSSNLPPVQHVIPLAPPDDPSVSLTWRARSYFQANCANCHRLGSFSSWEASKDHPLDQANIIDGILNDTRGDAANRVIAPGDPGHSMVLQRISTLGGIRMPPLGSSVVDTQAVALVTAWIGDLVGYQDYWAWALAELGSTNAPGTGPTENFDQDPANNLYEFLTRTDPDNAADFWEIDVSSTGGVVTVHFDRHPNAAYLVQYSADLQTWAPWPVPGNQPSFSAVAGAAAVSGPMAQSPRLYFRLKIRGH